LFEHMPARLPKYMSDKMLEYMSLGGPLEVKYFFLFW
jgi:hypothetical protein